MKYDRIYDTVNTPIYKIAGFVFEESVVDSSINILLFDFVLVF
jgi:hypothetical protein